MPFLSTSFFFFFLKKKKKQLSRIFLKNKNHAFTKAAKIKIPYL
jgi:hypothetical protein